MPWWNFWSAVMNDVLCFCVGGGFHCDLVGLVSLSCYAQNITSPVGNYLHILENPTICIA